MNPVVKPKLVYIILSGVAGSFFAVLADMTMKSNASAVVKMGDAIRTHLGLNCTNIIAAVILLAGGALVCAIFTPENRKKAFYLGASIITIIMTLTPYRVPNTISSEPAGIVGGGNSMNIIYEHALLGQAWAHTPPDTVETEELKPIGLNILIKAAKGKTLKEAVVTLRDYNNKKILASSKFKHTNFKIYQPKGEYIITIESPGHKIYEQHFRLDYEDTISTITHIDTLTTFYNGDSLEILLDFSRIPLTIQRLIKKH